jgi:hypothetical protein
MQLYLPISLFPLSNVSLKSNGRWQGHCVSINGITFVEAASSFPSHTATQRNDAGKKAIETVMKQAELMADMMVSN